MSGSSLLRPIGAADHGRVLGWNADHVELLAPLDQRRLDELLGLADVAAMIVEDEPVGFVLTFAAGSDYDSANYRWFAERHPAFVYLDRIVIDPGVRRSGIATRVYDELEADAARRAPVFCLEVNLEPPNEPSLAFHRRRGYVEVGRLDTVDADGGRHLVALLERGLPSR